MASVVEGSGTVNPSSPGRGAAPPRSAVSPITGRPLAGSAHQNWLQAVLHGLRRQAWPLITYLARTEVHTFAFSVACNAILSFFPFVEFVFDAVYQRLIRRVNNIVGNPHGPPTALTVP